MDRGAWWATVHGEAESQIPLSNFTSSKNKQLYVNKMDNLVEMDTFRKVQFSKTEQEETENRS